MDTAPAVSHVIQAYTENVRTHARAREARRERHVHTWRRVLLARFRCPTVEVWPLRCRGADAVRCLRWCCAGARLFIVNP
eukprot:scaffold13914_cov122-Isochrysis_galbana.AAC.4